MAAQKRRKNAIIVSFLCPVPLLAEVDKAVKEQQKNTRMAPVNSRSEWILRAIRRDLDHSRRSRRKRRQDVLVLDSPPTPAPPAP